MKVIVLSDRRFLRGTRQRSGENALKHRSRFRVA
jgi:hypothetical protein